MYHKIPDIKVFSVNIFHVQITKSVYMAIGDTG
jgi:hypothetical protein